MPNSFSTLASFACSNKTLALEVAINSAQSAGIKLFAIVSIIGAFFLAKAEVILFF